MTKDAQSVTRASLGKVEAAFLIGIGKKRSSCVDDARTGGDPLPLEISEPRGWSHSRWREGEIQLTPPSIDRDIPRLCVIARKRHRGSLLDDGWLTGYTKSMKTAISLPDTLFREAERLARRTRKPRSKLYAEALSEYIARHSPDEITESLNQVITKVDGDDSRFVQQAAKSLVTREAW